MKFTKFIIAVAAICAASSSLAQNASVGESATHSNSGAVASFDSHNTYEAQKPPVSSAFAPALTSTGDTCMGSTTGAVSSAIIGIALGSTYKDDDCNTRKDSRELWNMGQRSAAMARTCMNPLNREAMELSGFECPQTTKARLVALKAICLVDYKRKQVEATGYECPATVTARGGNIALQKFTVAGLAKFLDPIIASINGT